MNSSLLLPMLSGFATIILGMLGLFFATLRSTATLRRELREDIGALDVRMDSRIDRLDTRIDQIDAKVDRLGAQSDAARGEIRVEFQRGFDRLHEEYRDIRKRLDRLTDSLALRGLQLIEPADG